MGQRWRLRFKTKARLTWHRGSLGRLSLQPDSPCPTPPSIHLRLEVSWGRRQREEARVRYWQGGLVPWVCPEPRHGSRGDQGEASHPSSHQVLLEHVLPADHTSRPCALSREENRRKRSFPHAAFIPRVKRISARSPSGAWKSEWHLESPHLSLPRASGPGWQQLNSDAGGRVWEQGTWGSHSETPATCDRGGRREREAEGRGLHQWDREDAADTAPYLIPAQCY